MSRRKVAFFCGVMLSCNTVAATFDFGESDSHRPVTHTFVLRNTGKVPFVIAAARATCSCVLADYADEEVAAGQELPVTVRLDLNGLEGEVEQKVMLTLRESEQKARIREGGNTDGAGLSRRATSAGDGGAVSAVPVASASRPVELAMKGTCVLRAGLKPRSVAFGVVASDSPPAPVTVGLSGYAVTNAARARILAVGGVTDAVIPVAVSDDGLSLTVTPPPDIPRGLLSEVWTVTTSDPQVPVLRLPVSLLCAGDVEVLPDRLSVGPTEEHARRWVLIRPRGGAKPFRMLSAETAPGNWGDVEIEERPLGGWKINVGRIDVNAVRRMSGNPFVRVRTDLAGSETIEVPLRIEE